MNRTNTANDAGREASNSTAATRTRTLARAIVRGRLWIAVAWAVAAVVLVPFAQQAGVALDIAGNRTGESAASEIEVTDLTRPRT